MVSKKDYNLSSTSSRLRRAPVEHIAKLARLSLSKKELGKLQKDLSSILDYIEKLKKVDIKKAKVYSHQWLGENIMRDDQESKKLKMENKKLLELAPKIKDGYLKVKSIIKPATGGRR